MSALELELAALVERLVRHYSRRCWWADPDDIRSEAWVAALEARRRFDAERGLRIAQYARTQMTLGIMRYLLRHSSPVSAPDNRTRSAVIGLHRAPLDEGLPLDDSERLRRQRIQHRMGELLTEEEFAAAHFTLATVHHTNKRKPSARERELAAQAVEKIVADQVLRDILEA